jgi:hypothetical protein
VPKRKGRVSVGLAYRGWPWHARGQVSVLTLAVDARTVMTVPGAAIPAPAGRGGRRRVTSRAELEHVAVAAYEQWLQTEDADLGHLLDTAMRQLGAAFGNSLAPAPEAATAKAPTPLSAWPARVRAR